MAFATVSAFGLISVRRKYPIFDYLDWFKGLFKDNTAVLRDRLEFFKMIMSKVKGRLEQGESRPDFFSHIIKNQAYGEKALSLQEMESNSVLFLVAGSETTATTLSGTTSLLLRNPEAYAKVVNEVRSRFKTDAEITIESVNKLPYMIACLQEGLRCYPPVPTGFPRIVPAGGDTISGFFVPEGVSTPFSYPSLRDQCWKNHSCTDLAISG